MLRVIVMDIIETSAPNHPSGKKSLSLTLQNRERRRFYANASPESEMLIEPGDQIEGEPMESFEGIHFGSNVKIIKRQLISPIKIIATISDFRHRSVRRFSQWMAATISAEGFVSIAGNVALSLRLERGMCCEFTGFPAVGKDGKPSFDLIHGGVTVLERDSHDPVMVVARRAFPGFTASHLQTLRAELGEDWPNWVAEAAGSLSLDAFSRWKDATKRGIGKLAKSLVSLPLWQRDLMTVGVSHQTISKIAGEGRKGKVGKDIPPRGSDAMSLVRARHLTFSQADDANKLNGHFKPTLNRALGAIWDLMIREETKGNTAVFLSDVREYLFTQYGFTEQEIDAAIALAGEPPDHSLGIGKIETLKDRLSLEESFACERAIVTTIEDMKSREVEPCAIETFEYQFDETQKDAIRQALSHNISAITGGPGTGKTTICREIGEQLDDVLGIAVAARAARNLQMRADIFSMTVRRFLLLAKRDQLRKHGAIIIDEASMISSKDMLDILNETRAAGIDRIVMVGDKDQLPPVSCGAPFADLIAAGAIPVATLKTIYRTKEGGGIARLSAHVRDSEELEDDYEDVNFVSARGDSNAADSAVMEYMRLVRKGVKFEDIGLLTPYSNPKSPIGSEALNCAIRKALGKPVNCATIGDIVIGTKNIYQDRYVLNGSRGIVLDVKDGLTIRFECNETETEFYSMNELNGKSLPDGVAWGYASSIHKAQGGEFDHVIALVVRRMARLFGKPAIYTAFSRAKHTLTIVGDIDAIPAIAGERGRQRTTALAAMLPAPITEAVSATRAVIDINARLAALKSRFDRPDLGARLEALKDRLAAS